MEPLAIETTEKVCTACKEKKGLAEFYRDLYRKDQKNSRCIKCLKKYHENNREKLVADQKKYRENNPEKVAASQKKYRENNPEKVAAAKKKYRENNPEKVAAAQKKYKENNPEKLAAAKKKYRENNPEKVAALRKTWREKLLNSYLKNILKIKVNEIPNEILELKRLQLQIHRHLKGIKNEKLD